jgi:transposase InsO family protein
MDFVSDALADGRRFRCFTLVDDFTRECPAIAVDTSLTAARIIRVLEQLAATWGLPRGIVCDNGPEFAGHVLDAWAHRRGLKLHFIAPGKPVQRVRRHGRHPALHLLHLRRHRRSAARRAASSASSCPWPRVPPAPARAPS